MMQKGSCKRVKGGRKLCRLRNGKVRFVSKGRTAGLSGGSSGLGRSGSRKRRCVQKGRAKGRIVCRKYSGTRKRR